MIQPMPTAAGAAHAQTMDPARARQQLVDALADRYPGRPEAAYTAALTQIEALKNSPDLTPRQAGIGTRIVLDALAVALTAEEP